MHLLGTKLGFLTLLGLSLGACGVGHDIDVEFDCHNLCDRYRDCFDSSYDSGACATRCDEVANNDPSAANECDTCLDTRSCVDSFACGDECYGLIP